ncbi:MAG: ABC transporter permease [Ferruginibacter sp.]
MIKNYFKIAWRNLIKNKTFSAINIFGLAIGIAAFLLIVNYLRFEYSYDDMQVNKNRIYRVPMKVAEKDGKLQTFAFTYPALAPAMKKDFPEVEETVRFRRRGGIVKYGETKVVENGTIYFADPSVFNVFSFSFLQGNAKTAFTELNDVVITESTAKKYFGSADPMGKALNYNNEDYIVKAVLEDIPANAHLQFNVLLNYNKYIQQTNGRAETSWGWSDFYTYVLLKPGADVNALQAKMPAFAQRYMGDDMKEKGYLQTFDLQPIKDIHLRSDYDYELAGNGNLGYLKYLGIAALFILFIAWINYINLSTARSLDRSKEVGVRKVIGAGRYQLIRQFLTESLLINIIGILLGILIFLLSLKWFAGLIEKDITYLKVTDFKFWLFAVAVFLVGTFAAAFYPAFVLSSFHPIHTLKSATGISNGKTLLRKSLVVLQFTAAIVLIAGAIGFYRQLRFMQQQDLGVNIQQTLVLNQTANLDSSSIPSFAAFVNDMEANPAISSVTASTSVPGGEVGGSSDFNIKGSSLGKRCRIFGIDKKFIPAYGLKMVAGRSFSNDKPNTDTAEILNVILNETGAKVLGFTDPDKMIGQEIEGTGYHCKVIGIVKDYHQESLQYSYDPIVFYPEEERNFGFFSLKINTTNLPVLMDFVKQKWTANFPQSPYQFAFLDDSFNNQYKGDKLFSTVLWLFTVIAIIVASLGLFGLSLYTVAKRMKEISIRKVLGATVIQIAGMIAKDYVKLVLLAGIIALPVGYLLLNNWLQKYAFHISIDLWFFLLPVLLIVLIALVTVVYQSVRAAIANPVKSLRAE